MTIFSIVRHHQRRINTVFVSLVGRWLAITSSRILYSTLCPPKKNGKLKHQVYINSILGPVVKPWLEAGHDFVLKEDGDLGHGSGWATRVRKWKEEQGLKTYFNCAHSPTPIENCRPIPQSRVRKYPHWGDSTWEELIREGWARVSQEFINSKVDEMPERLQAVLDSHGNMTGY